MLQAWIQDSKVSRSRARLWFKDLRRRPEIKTQNEQYLLLNYAHRSLITFNTTSKNYRQRVYFWICFFCSQLQRIYCIIRDISAPLTLSMGSPTFETTPPNIKGHCPSDECAQTSAFYRFQDVARCWLTINFFFLIPRLFDTATEWVPLGSTG